MFKPDKPIKFAKYDILGRSVFSRNFGQAILDYSEEDSIVTAIYGDWGSGKSSVINMTLEYIEENSISKNEDEKPIVFKFNPWNYSDQSHLIAIFFKELSFALQHEDYGDKAKIIGERLEVYGNRFAPLASIPNPEVGGFFTIIQKIFNFGGKVFKALGAAYSKDLNDRRKELNKLLGEQERKLIIVIDDIDRLNDDEIRQIFQLVKMVGDFQNIIYVLAFDRGVVVKALEKVQKGFGDGYLEKIVQFSVELPPISESELEEILDGSLNEFIKKIPEGKWDSDYWEDISRGRIKNYFKTIRDVNRFINTLKFSFKMVRKIVNPVDFVAITALQVFEPDLYSGIKNNKDLFTGIIEYGYPPDDEKNQAASRCKEIIKRAKSFKGEEVIEFLSILFPKIEDIYGDGNYGSNLMSTWYLKERICHPKKFDTYFLLALPSGEIPNSEIRSVLDLAWNKETFKAELIRLRENGKIVKYLKLMENFTKDYILLENIQNITAVLMDVGDTFSEDESIDEMVSSDTNMRIRRILKQLNLRFDKQEDRFENTNKAINESTESIYTIVLKVGVLGLEHGKLISKTQAELEPDDKREVSEKQLTLLESRAVEKISEWVKEGKLDKHRNLASILRCWKLWDLNNPDAAKNYVKKMIVSDDGLIDFITAFTDTSFFQPEYNPSGFIINLKSVANFVDIKDIEPRIRKLQSSVNYPDFPNTKKDALDIFLGAYDAKDQGIVKIK